jgi:isoaspartyl peptidase/L-asparaginase-like protein (Ntn-hydrolase superfamily)
VGSFPTFFWHSLFTHSAFPFKQRDRTLVSSGAHNFASTRGVRTVPPESLITPSAKGKWEKWMSRRERPSVGIGEEKEAAEGLMDLQDTVGAVAFREADGVAAGVSRFVSSGKE